MKFKEFEYMRAIEAKKSITKAAQMLNVSQPAISRCPVSYTHLTLPTTSRV